MIQYSIIDLQMHVLCIEIDKVATASTDTLIHCAFKDQMHSVISPEENVLIPEASLLIDLLHSSVINQRSSHAIFIMHRTHSIFKGMLYDFMKF